MRLGWTWLGRVGYEDAVARMERLRARILDGDSSAETLLLLEHPATITMGRRTKPENLLATPDELAARGVALVRSSRGGDVTYHGPGQLVAYPVVRLGDGVVAHVERLAQAAVDVAAQHGVSARFDRDCPGVWTPDAKLAAIGVHVHRRVAIHGLALNVTTALDHFALIVPCGLSNRRVTSIAAESHTTPDLPSVAAEFAAAFARLSGRTLRAVDPQIGANESLQSDRPSVE
ncbi:MAG TPA: lipoyl(octanoyl) transferase LipB [Polyangia bacterium]|jgi:lipoyl(octanoyl) transferase|nr:lipoyl(octanoyl) transferase LipB [Polyangia bacterium]